MTELPPPVSELTNHFGMIGKVIDKAVNSPGHRYRLRRIDRDDVFQSLFVQLVRTTQTYDPAVGASWSGYAFTSLVLKIKPLLWEIRRRCRRYRNGVTYVPMSMMSRSLVRGTDPRYAREDSLLLAVDEQDEYERVVVKIRGLLDSLTRPRSRRVVTAFYGIGCDRKNVVELAEELGVTKQRVYQLLNNALNKMRKAARQTDPKDFV